MGWHLTTNYCICNRLFIGQQKGGLLIQVPLKWVKTEDTDVTLIKGLIKTSNVKRMAGQRGEKHKQGTYRKTILKILNS